MNKKNLGTGAGGSKTNLNGIHFEQKVYLYEWIIKKGYDLRAEGKSTDRTQLYKIYKGDEFIGWYGRQSKIYHALKELFPTKLTNEHIKSVLSKKINPDAFILTINGKLTIFEKKWQQSSGSVDEKIQTAPYKIEMFNKLLKNLNVEVSYQYILSSWFKKREYRNVKEYYENNKSISIWTYDENLDEMNVDNYM